MAIIRPLSDPADINRVYKRAILSDAQNADILRERETFALEYDKYGRGGKDMEGIICTGGQKCENCLMKERFAGELKDLSLGPRARPDVGRDGRDVVRRAETTIKFHAKVVVDNPWAGKLQQRLAGKEERRFGEEGQGCSGRRLRRQRRLDQVEVVEAVKRSQVRGRVKMGPEAGLGERVV